ncbi:MAG: hypothetical protein NC033_00440 [Clostridiales bacterium]|nr:hypothetical protein [Clostridiales bacterium]
MSTKSCAFFGHRHMNVGQYGEKLLNVICDLIENKGVTQFYSGFRGDFDVYCSELVHGLKVRYPQIKSTMALSYIPYISDDPDRAFKLPKYFDDSVYLLERRVPDKLAIIETNKLIVDKADFIVAGVITHCGGAYTACEYACKRKKTVISVIEGWEV